MRVATNVYEDVRVGYPFPANWKPHAMKFLSNSHEDIFIKECNGCLISIVYVTQT